jgi:transposase
LDNGAFHKAQRLIIPDNIALFFLPPYSPELNTAKKVWWTIKRTLKNKFFADMKELINEISLAAKLLSKQ